MHLLWSLYIYVAYRVHIAYVCRMRTPDSRKTYTAKYVVTIIVNNGNKHGLSYRPPHENSISEVEYDK